MTKRDPSSIGAIMRQYGLRPEQLHDALVHQQQHPGERLGQICVDLGFIDHDRREIAVHQQAAIRDGNLVPFLELVTKRTMAIAKQMRKRRDTDDNNSH